MPHDKFPVGPGWWDLIRPIAIRIEEIGGKVVQIKEKFGSLRLYCGVPKEFFEEIDMMVAKAEQLSEKTCENCGKPGTLRTNRYWIKTNCDECDKKYWDTYRTENYNEETFRNVR